MLMQTTTKQSDDSFLSKSLSIVITTKCPLRCDHCAIGIYGEPRDVPLTKLNEDSIKKAIRSACQYGYNLVNFVGGEPFMALDLLEAGVAECRSQGIKSSVVTAPMWASSKNKAKQILSRLTGLNPLIISFDNFHLKYLDMKHYENAANAAYEMGFNTVFNVCCSEICDREKISELLVPLDGRITKIQFVPILPVGNPKNWPKSIPFSGIAIQEPSDLDRLERNCAIGSSAVGLYKDVFACCWSMAVMNSSIRFDRNRSGNFEEDFRRIETDPSVQVLRKTGVLNRLTGEKKLKVFEAVKNRKFVNECHLCLYLMDKSKGALWKKYIGVPPKH